MTEDHAFVIPRDMRQEMDTVSNMILHGQVADPKYLLALLDKVEQLSQQATGRARDLLDRYTCDLHVALGSA
jgi:hypothetical protein